MSIGDEGYIYEIYNWLSTEDRHRAASKYISPIPFITIKTHNLALRDAMIEADCWPFTMKDITQSGAEEYEDIIRAQEIMDQL